jgi:transcriptional regulator with PAS, ATPase and Fis domain
LIGGKHECEVDVRVVATTNNVPKEAVRGGYLREDLFYRLNVFHVHLPPLHERKQDIRLLAEALLVELNHKHACHVTEITQAAFEVLSRLLFQLQKTEVPGSRGTPEL